MKARGLVSESQDGRLDPRIIRGDEDSPPIRGAEGLAVWNHLGILGVGSCGQCARGSIRTDAAKPILWPIASAIAGHVEDRVVTFRPLARSLEDPRGVRV